MKNTSRSLKINDKVIFTGFRKDIPDILSYCKILLLPSLNESFGRAAIEAMAAGLPIITCDHAAISQSVRDGLNGFIVEKKNP